MESGYPYHKKKPILEQAATLSPRYEGEGERGKCMSRLEEWQLVDDIQHDSTSCYYYIFPRPCFRVKRTAYVQYASCGEDQGYSVD